MAYTHSDYVFKSETIAVGAVNEEVTLPIAGRVSPAQFVHILSDIAITVRLNKITYDLITVPAGPLRRSRILACRHPAFPMGPDLLPARNNL